MSAMEQAATSATEQCGIGSPPPRAIWIFVGSVVAECFVRALDAMQATAAGEWRPAIVVMAVAAIFCWTALRGVGWAAWLYVLASLPVWIVGDGGRMHLGADGSVVCAGTLRLPLIALAGVALLLPQVRSWLHATAAHRATAWHRAIPSIF
jgi:hypothetical protein